MKIVRTSSKSDDITYGGVEPEGIRLYRGSPFVAWAKSMYSFPSTSQTNAPLALSTHKK